MCETYDEQVERIVDALARGETSAIATELDEGSSPRQLQQFADASRERRIDSLNEQLEFVAEAFDEFEMLIELYVRRHPLAAFDTVASDAERMLLWLLDKRALTGRQRDYVLCQRARHAVVELARCHRAGHLAFQRLRAAIHPDAVDRDLSTVRLHLNPIRAHATFVTTALLGKNIQPPTEALFFPDGHQIASLVLEPRELQALLTLANAEPCLFSDWLAGSKMEASELAELARRLLRAGLLGAEPI